MMGVPDHKTKIVCTIGPACSSEPALERLLRAGMAVARLNFAHGALKDHRELIGRIRRIASRLGVPCMILGDLPGPKIRLGRLAKEPLVLKKGSRVVLTPHPSPAAPDRIPVGYARLAQSVSAGKTIYLNDGFVQLEVEEIVGEEVRCLVVIGGELLSSKGVNIPEAELDLDPITEKDQAAIECGLSEGIDAFSLSFVRRARDIHALRDLFQRKGASAFVVAKIERSEAIEHIDELLEAADAVMIARGDMGVQIPLEDVPAVQKRLIRKANLAAKPVITATQMLASMTENTRPTRAEVSDVANAVLDGTDAVMLSEETAIGKYPVEAVEVLARILASAERHREGIAFFWHLADLFRKDPDRRHAAVEDIVSLNAVETAEALDARCIVTPTVRGDMARRISRFKPCRWILALTQAEPERNFLSLSYGVCPILATGADKGPDSLRELISGVFACEKGARIVVAGRRIHGPADEIESIRILTL
jgi:pyruvate kinase